MGSLDFMIAFEFIFDKKGRNDVLNIVLSHILLLIKHDMDCISYNLSKCRKKYSMDTCLARRATIPKITNFNILSFILDLKIVTENIR